MFRKPKSKLSSDQTRNIRRRIQDEAPTAIAVAEEKPKSADEDEREQETDVDRAEPQRPKLKGLMSFDEQEGDDVVNFKLKRHSHSHHRSEKAARKQQALVERMERLRAVAEEQAKAEVLKIKKEEPGDDVQFMGQKEASRKTPELPQQRKPKLKAPEGEKFDEHIMSAGDEAELEAREAELRGAFPTTMAGIPDAKAVYEARKKREMMRQVGGPTAVGSQEFIPLDDTVRLKSGPSGERARLVREDENDMSDEEETGSFYSAKKLLQSEEEKRREEQAHFLQLEQGSEGEEEEQGQDEQQHNRRRRGQRGESEDDEEEDALQRWEREQIRKGVSSNKVIQMQEERKATSLYYHGRSYMDESGEAEMDIEMDVEMIDRVDLLQLQAPRGLPALPPELSNGRASKITSMDDILSGLHNRLSDKRELHGSNEATMTRIETQMAENTDLIHKFEQSMPQLERKFRMFQETRLYTRDLLDCLNEKIVQIDALEEKVSEMWRQRADRLIRRRRQDVQDQYERCAATAAGRAWIVPTPEYAQREAEREGRRIRRRRERSKQQEASVEAHNDGLSSDDEETTSQEVYYRETIASVIQGARDLFMDTADDFCQLELILARLLQWLAIDPASFEQAYVPLCLPKLLGPFVRLQMLDWRPLKDPSHSLHTLSWYRTLLLAGLNNSGLEDLEHPALVQLIPSVVEKIVFPKIAKMIRDEWDPLSTSESTNLALLLRTIIDEYPVANAQSKRMQAILDQLHAKLRDALDKDTFVPLYSKEAIEATESGCGAFLDRQFWKSIKLMRSILRFRDIISEECLEELVIEGLVNRCCVLALQFSVLTHPSTMVKCRALIEQIPSSWLSRRASYRPLASIVKQIMEQHRRRDSEFIDRAQRLVDAVTIKEEEHELDDN